MRAEAKFTFFPGNSAPNVVRAAVAAYWVAFSIFFVRIVSGVGAPPFHTRPEVEAAIVLFGLLSAILIFYAFTIMRLSAGKLWARNVALVLTAFVIAITLYRLRAHGGSSGQSDVVGLISVAAETVAAVFLLTPKSASWFKSKISQPDYSNR